MSESKRVAILGAGVCGIVAIKSCLEEGLDPVCFEKTDKIGGLWNYRENGEENVSSVMKSTITNTSKEMTAFSDFPFPDHYPNYMYHGRFLEYLKLYIANFELEKHIKCQHVVTNITKADDFETNGEWIVEYKNMGKDGNREKTVTERFQAVMICTGHYAEKFIPKFPGAEEFQGKQMHSLDYKEPTGFEGKRILVVGLGNSSGDVAVELSRTAKQVYMSTRRGGWIMTRLTHGGMPSDLAANRRIVDALIRFLGVNMTNRILRKELNKKFDHRMFGLEPDHEPFSQHPVVNEDLPNRIMCGAIQIRPNILEFTESSVIFEDGSEVEVDVVIYATGYKYAFPFLTNDILKCENSVADLYKYVFPPEVKPATLAVIGRCAAWGSILPISELQSRWATRVFTGLAKLPTSEQMRKDINSNRESMARRYVASARHTMEAEFIPYANDIASRIGVKPSLVKLLVTDPPLFAKVLFGPCVAYQYRIMGPHSWSGAREAIMSVWRRVNQPMQTRQVPPIRKQSNILNRVLFLTVPIVLLYFYRSEVNNWISSLQAMFA